MDIAPNTFLTTTNWNLNEYNHNNNKLNNSKYKSSTLLKLDLNEDYNYINNNNNNNDDTLTTANTTSPDTINSKNNRSIVKTDYYSNSINFGSLYDRNNNNNNNAPSNVMYNSLSSKLNFFVKYFF
jgi:hypothetical protein